jgi:deoxyribodipyrimidine photo-lyase
VLYQNLESGTKVISVYIFDEKDYTPRRSTTCAQPPHLPWHVANMGPHAARLQIESVRDLQTSLRNIGGELLVRKGCPATILSNLVQVLDPTEVVWCEEPGIYEANLSRAVCKAIRAINPLVPIQTHFQYTLYHPDDLPRGEQDWTKHVLPKNSKKNKKSKPKNVQTSKASPHDRFHNRQDCFVDISPERWSGMPRIMGEFRKAAREACSPRPCLAPPTMLSTPDNLPPSGDIPTLMELYEPFLASSKTQSIMGLSYESIEAIHNAAQRREAHRSRGGESYALSHLQDFCQHHASTAARNLACVENHQSSRLSHLLALGCLSPRRVVETAQQHGDGCHWIISHMTMRDFFLYACLAHGSQFYHRDGIPISQKHSSQLVWKDWNDPTVRAHWESWALGETGLPLVDAGMKELLETGYCSNRVRQNIASVLTKDLGIDWRAGAEWFQFLLEDHCVGANWGNWLYFSGVGPDPKQRHFRTVSQALKYDPDGSYVKKWLPVLQQIPGAESYLRPWDYTAPLGWKVPIVQPQSQYTWQDSQRLMEDGFLIHAPPAES